MIHLKSLLLYLIRLPLTSKRLKYNMYKQYVDKGYVFIHIPKAAGSSINKTLYNNLGLGHFSAKNYIETFGLLTFKSMFKFTFVRNPYDRFISAYLFLQSGGMTSLDDEFYKIKMSKFKDINDFVQNGLIKDDEIQNWIHFKTQKSFVYFAGKCQVDFIGKFESIDKDFQYIKDVLGVKKELEKTNITTSNSIKNDKQLLLTNESKKLLYDIYDEDFKTFKYDK